MQQEQPQANGDVGADLEEKLEGLSRVVDALKGRTREIKDPSQIALLRDPETGKRIPQVRKTPQGIVVKFLPLTIGESRQYDAQQQGKPFAHWPVEDQCRLYNENVLEPDFSVPEFADGPLTPEWVDRNFDWLSWVEMGTEVVKGSRADFRVPAIEWQEEDGKKKALEHPTDSASPSSTSSSTTEGTGT